LFKGLSPLFDCQNVIYGGHTEGGRGMIPNKGVCQDLREGIISY